MQRRQRVKGYTGGSGYIARQRHKSCHLSVPKQSANFHGARFYLSAIYKIWWGRSAPRVASWVWGFTLCNCSAAAAAVVAAAFWSFLHMSANICKDLPCLLHLLHLRLRCCLSLCLPLPFFLCVCVCVLRVDFIQKS